MANKNLGEVQSIAAILMANSLIAELDGGIRRISVQNFLDSIVPALDDFGDVTCESISSRSIPMVCGRPLILYGLGAPSADTVPDNWDAETMGEWTGAPCFIGQHYIDTAASSGGEYYAKGTGSVSDWRIA